MPLILIYIYATPTSVFVYKTTTEAPTEVLEGLKQYHLCSPHDRNTWLAHLSDKKHKYQIREVSPHVTEYKRCFLS